MGRGPSCTSPVHTVKVWAWGRLTTVHDLRARRCQGRAPCATASGGYLPARPSGRWADTPAVLRALGRQRIDTLCDSGKPLARSEPVSSSVKGEGNIRLSESPQGPHVGEIRCTVRAPGVPVGQLPPGVLAARHPQSKEAGHPPALHADCWRQPCLESHLLGVQLCPQKPSKS